jgi:hypothetical protein
MADDISKGMLVWLWLIISSPVGNQHLSLHVKFISKKQNCGIVLTL